MQIKRQTNAKLTQLIAFYSICFLSITGIVCSYAFALPVATAPNAIVFGHSTMKTADMMKVLKRETQRERERERVQYSLQNRMDKLVQRGIV